MWNIHNTTSDTLCTIYNTNGITKYRKGPTKDLKGPTKEHYTGPQRIGNTAKQSQRTHKAALHTGPQRIGNTIKDRKGPQWTTVEHYTGPQRIGNTAKDPQRTAKEHYGLSCRKLAPLELNGALYSNACQDFSKLANFSVYFVPAW